MEKKIVVGIIFGGKSAEHEISLLSAKNICDALDKEKFEPVLIKIDKSGKWEHDSGFESVRGIDVAFPILHGPFGEDGTIQGFLKIADIPFVGAGVLASAVSMDKVIMKRLMRDAGIPIGKFISLKSNERRLPFSDVEAALGNPVFIKPANMGSSVGINKVNSEAEYAAAVNNAFQYDTKIIIEEFIRGREIECAVLGNEEPIASVPGEVVPSHDFYSYDAKYVDENGASLKVPAMLGDKAKKQIQELAVKVFKALCCEGLSRVDFFLKDNGEVIVNEINTMPGFTKVSMYPKMWEATGIPYTELLTRLIYLALDRFVKEIQLKTSVV
jgi:D-alanine-D-alanine ligase